MKSPILSLFFLCIILGQKIYAQNNYYFSDSSAQWNLLEIEHAHNTIYSTRIFSADGDVLLGNYHYQQIISGANHDFIRRDSTGKVFYRSESDTMDHLIYNFGKVQGDTFSFYNPWISVATIYVTVESTDTVLWDKPRKRMFNCLHFDNFDTTCYNPVLVCVDGIGALNSDFLFPGAEQAIPNQPQFSLLCYFNDSNLVYHDPAYQACSIDSTVSGIRDADWLNTIHLLPNPVSENFVTVQFNESPPSATSIQLFDLTGRVILQKPLTDKSNRIALNDLAKGMYLYNIISSEENVYSGKLVIQ